MDKRTIGTNAGIIWHLLDSNKLWECNELKEASGLSLEEFFAAIGWLAREDKIHMEKRADHKLYFALPINVFY